MAMAEVAAGGADGVAAQEVLYKHAEPMAGSSGILMLLLPCLAAVMVVVVIVRLVREQLRKNAKSKQS